MILLLQNIECANFLNGNIKISNTLGLIITMTIVLTLYKTPGSKPFRITLALPSLGLGGETRDVLSSFSFLSLFLDKHLEIRPFIVQIPSKAAKVVLSG